MKCFEKSKDNDLFLRSKASFLAEEATKELVSIDSEITNIKEKIGNYEKINKKSKRLLVK